MLRKSFVSDVTHVLLSLLVIIVVVVIVVLLPVGSRGGLDRGMLQGYKDLEKKAEIQMGDQLP